MTAYSMNLLLQPVGKDTRMRRPIDTEVVIRTGDVLCTTSIRILRETRTVNWVSDSRSLQYESSNLGQRSVVLQNHDPCAWHRRCSRLFVVRTMTDCCHD